MLKSLQVFTSKKNKRVIIDKTTPMNDFGLDQRDDEETKMSLNVWKHIEIFFLFAQKWIAKWYKV